MPRQPRIDIEGHLYHVIARGIERGKIFRDTMDYEDFLTRFKTALEKTGGKCLAWCLMPNHFHLLILRGKQPLAEIMRRVMTGYAVGFNIRHKRSGHLFQNRYKSILCDEEEYLLELVAYIHLNPLRAGMVRDLAGLVKYKWCGHGALTGMQKAGFLEREYILGHFDKYEKVAIRKYEAFLKDRQNKYKGKEYSGGGLIRSMGGFQNVLNLRKSGEKELFDDRVLGNGDFVESVMKGSNEPEPKKMTKQQILAEVKRMTGISYKELTSKSRERGIVKGRAVYCYLCKGRGGVNGAELMKELGLSSGTVSYLTHMGRMADE